MVKKKFLKGLLHTFLAAFTFSVLMMAVFVTYDVHDQMNVVVLIASKIFIVLSAGAFVLFVLTAMRSFFEVIGESINHRD